MAGETVVLAGTCPELLEGLAQERGRITAAIDDLTAARDVLDSLVGRPLQPPLFGRIEIAPKLLTILWAIDSVCWSARQDARGCGWSGRWPDSGAVTGDAKERLRNRCCPGGSLCERAAKTGDGSEA
ncbi:hypothetical protein [Streptomyces sp. NPDC097610]|uniref:hypothetical protein n=1 Tax=Streptomyces sp. NPDC097610 TaxID=3157227 RepID=UPI00332CB739